MEGIILDACTIINILNIDEDEVLFKKLISFQVLIAEEVLREARLNAGKKFVRLRSKATGKKYDDALEQSVNQRIGKLIRFQTTNKSILDDSGKGVENLKQYVDYRKGKENGEFLSASLAWNTRRKMNTYINFFTDDFKAKKQFHRFFEYQQVGFIQDSVDFLLYLYCFHQAFNESRLVDYLRKLMNEYAFEISELSSMLNKELKRLQNNKSEAAVRFLVSKLIAKLDTKNIKGIIRLKEEITEHRRRSNFNYNLFSDFEEVFLLDNIDEEYNLVEKIEATIREVKSFPLTYN